MPIDEKKTEPIQLELVVECPVEDAFDLFTEHFAEWWPLDSHSLGGEDAETCAIEPKQGGRVYERSRSGEERDWGSVIEWDRPKRVAFTWHPGGREDDQVVEVTFSVVADGTRIVLTHTGWEYSQALASIECAAASFRRFVCQVLVTA